MEATRRRGRRRKKLLDDLKDRRGYSNLKEEALDRTMWRAGYGRGLALSSDRLLICLYSHYVDRRSYRHEENMTYTTLHLKSMVDE